MEYAQTEETMPQKIQEKNKKKKKQLDFDENSNDEEALVNEIDSFLIDDEDV